MTDDSFLWFLTNLCSLTDDRFFSFPPVYIPCKSDDRSAAIINDNYIGTMIDLTINDCSSVFNVPWKACSMTNFIYVFYLQQYDISYIYYDKWQYDSVWVEHHDKMLAWQLFLKIRIIHNGSSLRKFDIHMTGVRMTAFLLPCQSHTIQHDSFL